MSAETITRIPLKDLRPSPLSPYVVRDDEAMRILAESVRICGILTPAIVRPADGGYEIVSGHRRKYACELAGFDEMPCIVRDLDDDEAVIQMVDANAQRDEVLPSERAKAYQLRLEAIKRQGQRTDLTSTNDSAKFRSDDLIGAECGVSGDTVRNTIKLNNLIPPLMRMVDEKKISLPRLSDRGPHQTRTGTACGDHRQRTGDALRVPGTADEEAEPGRRTERGHHARDPLRAEETGIHERRPVREEARSLLPPELDPREDRSDDLPPAGRMAEKQTETERIDRRTPHLNKPPKPER